MFSLEAPPFGLRRAALRPKANDLIQPQHELRREEQEETK
jgi:hypothetical protein